MALKKNAFTRYKLDEEKAEETGKVITIRLNQEELQRLEDDARLLEQEKAGSTIKILAEIGHEVLQDQKTGLIIRTIFKNKRNNQRLGISVANPTFSQK